MAPPASRPAVPRKNPHAHIQAPRTSWISSTARDRPPCTFSADCGPQAITAMWRNNYVLHKDGEHRSPIKAQAVSATRLESLIGASTPKARLPRATPRGRPLPHATLLSAIPLAIIARHFDAPATQTWDFNKIGGTPHHLNTQHRSAAVKGYREHPTLQRAR